MSHARALGIAGLVIFAAAAVAYAQTTVTPVPDSAPVETAPLEAAVPEHGTWGDVQNGQTLAGTCAACHGLDGNSEIPMYPRIAGQSERYIANQLALYKSGERSGGLAAVMKPFADMFSAQEAHDLGAYFATQKSGAGVADDTLVTSGPFADRKFYEIGERLFRGGDAARNIPACMACHGPEGGGNPGPAYPHVGGQYAEYSQQRLELYRAGTSSRTDPHLFNIMASIAKPLTDEEIGSLASYMQGLHAAADDIGVDATALAAAASAAPAAAPADEADVDQPADADADTDASPESDSGSDPAADAPDEAAPAADAEPEASQG